MRLTFKLVDFEYPPYCEGSHRKWKVLIEQRQVSPKKEGIFLAACLRNQTATLSLVPSLPAGFDLSSLHDHVSQFLK